MTAIQRVQSQFAAPNYVGGILIAGFALFATVVLGAAVAYKPLVALMLGGLTLAYVLVVGFNSRLPSVFLRTLTALLIGYALFGRGIAHAGAPPVYVGEIALGLGVLSLLITLDVRRLGFMHFLLIAFMLIGAMRTFPFISVYDIDALRDAVIWGYGIFAFAVFFALKPAHFVRIASVYRTILPFLLIWMPIASLSSLTGLAGVVPAAPGSEVPLIVFKGGDAGVHLGGAAAFIILGLYGAAPGARFSEVFVWSLWFVGLAVSSLNRGGMMAAGICAVLANTLAPSTRLVPFVGAASVIIFIAALLNVSIQLDRSSRPISVDEILARAVSVVSDDQQDLSGTKEWRQRWWGEIINYTVKGPYFWSGKGFGINLADADGFQVESDSSLRSPHNGHMSILARMGVPGISTWILLQALFAGSLLVGFFRMRAAGRTFWAQIDGWLLFYWLAIMINMSFDVYFESPQGSILFWSIFGAGLAALAAQRLPAAQDPDPIRLGRSSPASVSR